MMKELEWSQDFPYYDPMEATWCICYHRNQSSDLIWPKTWGSLFLPTPMMLQMKFEFDWPAGLKGIPVWKCECNDTRADAGSSRIL